MAKKIQVIGNDCEATRGAGGQQLRKQSPYGGEKWEPGMLPTGVLRTKVRYDSPAPYGQHSEVENPVNRTGKA